MMSILHCPSCGRATLAVRGLPVADQCRRCGGHLAAGEHLSRSDPRALKARVRERVAQPEREPEPEREVDRERDPDREREREPSLPAGATDRRDRPLVHPVVARAGAYAWRLIGIGIVGWAVLELLSALWVLVLAGALSVLLSRVLDPVANMLRRRGVPAALVATITLGGFLLVMAGIVTLLTPSIIDEFSDLGPTLEQSVDDLQEWLVEDSPFDISRQDLNDFRDEAGDRARKALESQRGAAISRTVVAFEVVTGLVLSLVTTFFVLKDGDRFCRWLLTFVPRERQTLARRLAARAWRTLGGYLRGSATLGLIEGVIIGGTVWIVGGALALPVAVITFFAAFLPSAGAVLAGAVAVLVTLVSAGVTPAVIVLVVAVVVQQLDGQLLAPIVFGRNLELHPLVVLGALVAGGTLFGALGAILAVPVTAVVVNVAAEWRAYNRELAEGDAPSAADD